MYSQGLKVTQHTVKHLMNLVFFPVGVIKAYFLVCYWVWWGLLRLALPPRREAAGRGVGLVHHLRHSIRQSCGIHCCRHGIFAAWPLCLLHYAGCLRLTDQTKCPCYTIQAQASEGRVNDGYDQSSPCVFQPSGPTSTVSTFPCYFHILCYCSSVKFGNNTENYWLCIRCSVNFHLVGGVGGGQSHQWIEG